MMKVYHEGVCPRCPSVGRKPNPLISNVFYMNGRKIVVCDQCKEEIEAENNVFVSDEIEEDEDAS